MPPTHARIDACQDPPVDATPRSTRDEFVALRRAFADALAASDFERAGRLVEALHRCRPDRPDGMDARCRLASAAAPPGRAVATLREVADREGATSGHRLRLAGGLRSLGRLVEAERIARDVLLRAPEDRAATIDLARTLQAQGRWQEARSLWLERAEAEPDAPGALRGLIACDVGAGDWARAHAGHARLIELGADGPVERYRLATLDLQARGERLSPEASGRLLDGLPPSAELVALHAQALGRAGRNEEALAYLEGARETMPGDVRAVRQEIAGALNRLRRYAEASATYLELYRERPRAVSCALLAVRCLASAEGVDAARALLEALDLGERCAATHRLLADIHGKAGHRRDAVRHAVGAVRAHPGQANLRTLCEALLGAGRDRRAADCAQRLHHLNGDDPASWKTLATLWLQLGRVDAAWPFLSRHLAVFAHDASVGTLASQLFWLRGEHARAWYARLASATADPVYLSSDEELRLRAYARLQSALEACAADADGPDVDPVRTVDALRRRLRLVPRPDLLKALAPPTATASRAFALLSTLEADAERSDARAGDDALERLERALPDALASTSDPVCAGNLLRRVSRLCERLGRHDRALVHLERAAGVLKADRSLVRLYRESLRERFGRIETSGSPRALVLMVTCRPNAARAASLASALHRCSGREVVVMSANGSETDYRLTPNEHGYELSVPGGDDYLSLSRKLLLAYRFLYACSDCTGVLKIDDDVLVEDGARLNGLLERCASDPSGYVGSMSRFVNSIYHHGRGGVAVDATVTVSHDPVSYCSGGAGYYLSRDSLRIIFDSGLTHYGETRGAALYEDVLFGEILHRAGVVPSHVPMPGTGGYRVDVFEAASLPRAAPEEPAGRPGTGPAAPAADPVAGPTAPVGPMPMPRSEPMTESGGADIPPKGRHVLIVTHGRSGSTLLQGVLNAIDGWHVKGENGNFAFPVFESLEALRASKEPRATKATDPTHPWFGIETVDLDRYRSLAGELVRGTVGESTPPDAACRGFKEIRYLDVLERDPSGDTLTRYLDFLAGALAPAKLLLLTREPERTMRSGFWKAAKDREHRLSLLHRFSDFCDDYAREHPDVAFRLHYEDLLSPSGALTDMFAFLGTAPSPERLNEVMSTRHSYAVESFAPESLPPGAARPGRPAALTRADRLHATGRHEQARAEYAAFVDERRSAGASRVPFHAAARGGRQAFIVRSADAARLAYLPVPKCACTSVSHLLYEITHGRRFDKARGTIHGHYWSPDGAELDLGRYADHYKFTVVRDPIARFVSGYRNRILHHDDLRPLLRGGDPPGINEFARRLEHYVARSRKVESHFLPQRRRLGDDLSVLDDVFPIEDLDRLVSTLSTRVGRPLALPHEQTGGPRMTVDELDERSVAFLLDFYAEDYRLLGEHYSPDVHLSSRVPETRDRTETDLRDAA